MVHHFEIIDNILWNKHKNLINEFDVWCTLLTFVNYFIIILVVILIVMIIYNESNQTELDMSK